MFADKYLFSMVIIVGIFFKTTILSANIELHFPNY